MRLARGILCLAMLAGLSGCWHMRIVEDTPMAVSIRYDGVVRSLEDATAAAQKACAAHGKIAHLRATETIAAAEHYAHFDCVRGETSERPQRQRE